MLHDCGLAADHWAQGREILDQAQADIDFLPAVVDTLHRLKAMGLRLGIVTNTFDTTHIKLGWFRRAGIDALWDSFATSCELGLVKPNPGIYLTALAPLDVYPGEAVFVGHAQAELAGAKRLGLGTIAFNRDDERVQADQVVSSFDSLERIVRDETDGFRYQTVSHRSSPARTA